MEKITLAEWKRPIINMQPSTNTAYDNSCDYLTSGICEKCTCSKCIGGRIYLPNTLEHSKICDCRIVSRRNYDIKKSGLKNKFDTLSFESYKIHESWHQDVVDIARRFVDNYRQNSFFISGQSNCGKTQIIIPIINEIFKDNNRIRFEYFDWLKDAKTLKNMYGDSEEYSKTFNRYANADILYLDHLFYPSIDVSDIKHALPLLNARCDSGKTTLIESQFDLGEIDVAIDGRGNAVTSRIIEMCGHGDFVKILDNSIERNYILKYGGG